jgi:hypothetical protein
MISHCSMLSLFFRLFFYVSDSLGGEISLRLGGWWVHKTARLISKRTFLLITKMKECFSFVLVLDA